MLGQSRMIAYIDNMAGKKGANLKYGEPTRNVCATIPLSLDETIRSLASQMLPRASYSASLVEALRIGAGVLAGEGRHAVCMNNVSSEQDKPRRPL